MTWILYWNSRLIHCFAGDEPVSLCHRWKRTAWVDESRTDSEDSCQLCLQRRNAALAFLAGDA